MKTIRIELLRRNKKYAKWQPAVIHLPAETKREEIKSECIKDLKRQGLEVHEISITGIGN